MLARGSIHLLQQNWPCVSICYFSGNSQEEIEVNLRKLDSEQLLSYNPKLIDYTPATRIAYARFKSKLQEIEEPEERYMN